MTYANEPICPSCGTNDDVHLDSWDDAPSAVCDTCETVWRYPYTLDGLESNLEEMSNTLGLEEEVQELQTEIERRDLWSKFFRKKIKELKG